MSGSVANLSFALPEKPEDTTLPVSKEVLNNAHAHNDYLHDYPLGHALSCGFTSIEADIHLVDGKLYLGHNFPRKDDKHLLSNIYLKPLNDLLNRQGGKIYPEYDGVFLFMIDIKTSATPTFVALQTLLDSFPMLTNNHNFQIFISGNRPAELFKPGCRIGIDGRPEDLNEHLSIENMPVISDNFKKHFKWRGKGKIPEAELQHLQHLAQRTHNAGKKLRFWAIPDQPLAWKTLLDAGVDLICTDKMEEMKVFFAERNKQPCL